MKLNSVWKADCMLLLVAVIWGGGFSASKFALSALEPVGVLFCRFSMAAAAIACCFFSTLRKATRQEALFGCLLGLLMFFGELILLTALQYTTVAKQSFLASAYVIFTPAVSWLLFKNRPQRKDAVAAGVVLLGVGLLSLEENFSVQSGDFFTLGYTVLFALQMVLIERFAKGFSALRLTFFQLLTAGFLSFCTALVTDVSIRPGNLAGVGGILYLAFINTALALTLQNHALQYTKANHAALILSLESVFGLFLSLLFFDTALDAKMLAGCAFIFCGLLIAKLEFPGPAYGKAQH